MIFFDRPRSSPECFAEPRPSSRRRRLPPRRRRTAPSPTMTSTSASTPKGLGRPSLAATCRSTICRRPCTDRPVSRRPKRTKVSEVGYICPLYWYNRYYLDTFVFNSFHLKVCRLKMHGIILISAHLHTPRSKLSLWLTQSILVFRYILGSIHVKVYLEYPL